MYMASWLVERFPPNYQNMTYFEPFVGSGSVLLTKEPSKEEVINDSDEGLISVWRALRDEPKHFLQRVKRMEYKEKTFDRCKNDNGEDYICTAVKEFALRQMSKSGQKKVFLPKEGKIKCKDCWKSIFELVPDISERIQNVYILNKDALKTIKSFSNENCLMYCDPPEIDGAEMNANKHIELGEVLNEFRGKAIISATNSALYKRIYAKWNRKGVPGHAKESIWMNF